MGIAAAAAVAPAVAPAVAQPTATAAVVLPHSFAAVVAAVVV